VTLLALLLLVPALIVASALGVRRAWGTLAREGAVGGVAGVVTYFWPGLTAVGLILLIAAWSIVTAASALVPEERARELVGG
jgi:uncharacterized membrane protein HdeD (DUF308 family)